MPGITSWDPATMGILAALASATLSTVVKIVAETRGMLDSVARHFPSKLFLTKPCQKSCLPLVIWLLDVIQGLYLLKEDTPCIVLSVEHPKEEPPAP